MTIATPQLSTSLINFAADPGPALAAERMTPEGLLSWRILVRDDGALPGQGRLPVLIQWQGRHPTEAMPPAPVVLQAVRFGAVQPREATLLRFRGAQVAPGGPVISVTLDTPRGPITLTTA